MATKGQTASSTLSSQGLRPLNFPWSIESRFTPSKNWKRARESIFGRGKGGIHGILIPLGLEDVLDDQIPRPCETDPGYENWKSWSKVVRCWLLNQLSPTVIENLELFCRRVNVEVDLEDQLPRYAGDLYTLAGKAFIAGEECMKSKAAIAIRTTRRDKFESAGEYIEEWKNVTLQLYTQSTPIDFYVAIKLMFPDLRDEMPMTVTMLEDKIPTSVSRGRFIELCGEVITKSESR